MNNKRNLPKSIKKSLTIFGSAFFLILVVFITHQMDISLNNKKINESIIKSFTLSQLVSVAGQPIKWVKTINVSSVNTEKHFLDVPKTASNIKLSILGQSEVNRI